MRNSHLEKATTSTTTTSGILKCTDSFFSSSFLKLVSLKQVDIVFEE